MKIERFILAGTVGVAAIAGYRCAIQPWYKDWGATPNEIASHMPLDERVFEPTVVTTRAITIRATPEQIWPWLVQIGEPPRAGYYSYTFIEKLLGMDVINANRLLPNCQTLTVGQALDARGTMVVQAVEPERSLVLGPPESVHELQTTWAFELRSIDENSTRLVTRVRAAWDWNGVVRNTPFYSWPMWLVIDPGVFIMERKMLLELKRLAEQWALIEPRLIRFQPAA
jgi:hypothetical protein